MPTELLIIGTSGMAREAAQLARQADPAKARWTSITFVSDDASQLGLSLGYGKVDLTDASLDLRTEPADVVIGIGYPGARRKVAQRLMSRPHLTFPNLIDPDVIIDSTCVRLGKGNIITRGVVMTCDITIGDFNLFNWNVTVGHDVTVGSYNVINPGSNLSGFVGLGDECLVGTGSQILERRRIASEIVVGAGAVVTRSLDQRGTYAGIPARLMAC